MLLGKLGSGRKGLFVGRLALGAAAHAVLADGQLAVDAGDGAVCTTDRVATVAVDPAIAAQEVAAYRATRIVSFADDVVAGGARLAVPL